MIDPTTVLVISCIMSFGTALIGLLAHSRIKSGCCSMRPANNANGSLEDTQTDALKLSTELKEILKASRQFDDGIELQHSKANDNSKDIHEISDELENNL